MNRPHVSLALGSLLLACSAHAPAPRATEPAPSSTPAAVASAPAPDAGKVSKTALDRIGESYVVLVLSLGEHDPGFVDAYYGPAELQERAKTAARSLESIRLDAVVLRDELAKVSDPEAQTQSRRQYLDRQLAAVIARVDARSGTKLSFDQESLTVYDAVSPDFDEAHFVALVKELDPLLPGKGSLQERYSALRKRFEIPKDKLDAVFRRALEACRERTMAHLTLPAGESFTLEYVTDKPWAGYNWYKGGFKSVIQLNTSLPTHIDRALDVACHEGYPGHHVYNMLLEQHLVNERGWVEHTVYALFSPQSLIAEGTANYGVELAFPGDTRWQWERDNLFPLAGFDPKLAESYYRLLGLTKKLEYAGNVAAKRYLDGQMTSKQAIAWLMRFTLATRERAEQRVRFFDNYRAYVINYNVGRDLVRKYVETEAGSDEGARWRTFNDLLASPRLPRDLARN